MILVLIILVALAMGVVCWPKTQALPACPSTYVGYYRGLGLVDTPGLLGKSYYKFTLPPSDIEDGICEVQFEQEGYNPFRGFYPDGTLREEGECLVEVLGSGPLPDIHDVRRGRYYKPDGSLGSIVANGSGVQTYWTRDGVKVWELQLRGFKRIHLRMWNYNGEPIVVKEYAKEREVTNE